jgi:hypothetical protein
MTTILEQLAAGRIDAAEAARRIDALKAAEAAQQAPEPVATDSTSATGGTEVSDAEATPVPSNAEPSNEELAAKGSDEQDPWAAETDRPQYATHRTESFLPPPGTQDPAGEPARNKPVNTSGVERISVRAVGRRVRIVGETSVATLSADGPHVLRRNGAVLEVSSDGELGASLDGFSILRGAPRSLDDIRALGLGKELLLKVNPNIAVDVEVTAGSLNTERVPHLGKVRVTAGGAKLLDVREINDALIQAGQATIQGAITTGRNRIRAESGSLSITLADESNVTVKGDAQLGKVSWAGGHSGAGDEVVMGNGSAKLDIEVVMGHAQVRVGSDRPSEAGVA